VRVDIVIGDEDAPAVLDSVRRNSGVVGRGVYWMTTIEQSGRL